MSERSRRPEVAGGGDKAEFERLYRETFPRIYNYLYYQVLDQQLAEDLAADAYIKAYRAFDRYDPSRSSFSTWMHTIAHNELMNHYRRRRPTTDIEDLPESVLSTTDSYEEATDRADQVRSLLSHLDEDDREIVYLKFWEGLQNKEIAQRLDMNASTVSSRVARALAKLRPYVDPDLLDG